MMHRSADDSSTRQQIEGDYRWNFTVNTLDGANFWFGVSFISPTVILPLFVRHLTANPVVIGLIPFLAAGGYLLPQLFIANAVERAPRKKFFPATLGLFLERLPVVLLVPLAYFLAANNPLLALIGFFVLYAWFRLGSGLIIVGWQDMIAKIIPVGRRGRFFGVTNFIGNGTGILGAVTLPFVLQRFAFPLGFVFSFSVAAVFILISWTFLSLTREPSVRQNHRVSSQTEYLRSLPSVVRRDGNFRMYLLSQIVFRLSSMATGFLVVYAAKSWHVSDSQASGYTVALQVGLAAANLFFGFFSDRRGHKLTLELGILLQTLSAILAVSASSPTWFYLILFLQGSVSAVVFVSGISIVYEFTTPEKRATYIGLANTIPGIAASIAPLLGGLIAGALSYRAMFVVAAVIGFTSWALLHFAVRDPRKEAGPAVDGSPPTSHST